MIANFVQTVATWGGITDPDIWRTAYAIVIAGIVLWIMHSTLVTALHLINAILSKL